MSATSAASTVPVNSSSIQVSKLESVVPDFRRALKIVTFNVNAALEAQKTPDTCFNVRAPRIIALIKELIEKQGADIICLQELRNLPDSMTVDQFLAHFPGFYHEVAYRNPSAASFAQAILYRSTKFFPLNTCKKWLSATPNKVSDTFSNGFGAIVQCVCFAWVFDGKLVNNVPPIWIFNTHFPLDESAKTQSCLALQSIILKKTKGAEFLLVGDFNFFADKDGPKQRALLCQWMQDLGKGAKTLLGKQVEGTFIGYDYDPSKADLTNMTSRLDHVFGSANVVGTTPILYTKTMLSVEPVELTTRQYPSDHLPLVVDIVIN